MTAWLRDALHALVEWAHLLAQPDPSWISARYAADHMLDERTVADRLDRLVIVRSTDVPGEVDLVLR